MKKKSILYLAAVFLMPLVAEPVLAADASSAKADEYFRFMANKFTPQTGAEANAVELKNGRVAAGYFRMLVTRRGDPILPQTKQGCEAALKQFGSENIMQLIFKDKTDAGLVVRIPLEAVPGKDAVAGKFAEINLFALQRDGNNCRVGLTYFDQGRTTYRSPLIAIKHEQATVAQYANIEVKPWINIEKNKGRIEAFWRGLSGFVGLFGPVGTLLGIGQDGDDKYGLRSQAKASVLNFTEDVTMPTDAILHKDILVNPVPAGSTAPHRAGWYSFTWDIGSGVKFDFAVELQYRGSIFLDTAKMPDWSGKSRTDYQNMMTVELADPDLGFPTNTLWLGISDAMKNLSEQKNPSTFQAACSPALSELKRLGLSTVDQQMMIYALAMGRSGMTDYDLIRVDCLNSAAAKEAYAAFGVKAFAGEQIQTVLPHVENKQVTQLMEASYELFRSPVGLGKIGPNVDIRRFLAPEIRIWGKYDLLADAAGNPIFGNPAAGEKKVTRDEFLEKWKGLKNASPVGCGVPFPKDAEAMPALLRFPEFSGVPKPDDRIFAFMAHMAENKTALVIWGIDGKNADGFAQVSNLWIGDSFENEDTELPKIKQLMSAGTNCTASPFKAKLGVPVAADGQPPVTRNRN